jgi:hypothetical protein
MIKLDLNWSQIKPVASRSFHDSTRKINRESNRSHEFAIMAQRCQNDSRWIALMCNPESLHFSRRVSRLKLKLMRNSVMLLGYWFYRGQYGLQTAAKSQEQREKFSKKQHRTLRYSQHPTNRKFWHIWIVGTEIEGFSIGRFCHP